MTRTQTIALLKIVIPALGVISRDAIGLIGLGAVIHGVTMLSVAAGWIVGGVALVTLAVLTTRRQPK